MSEKPAIPGRPKAMAQQAAAAEKKVETETPEQKQFRRRRQVATEVLQTETSYCTSLAALVDVAVPILKEVLTEDENKLLFSNISTILQFNQNFCANLDQCLKCWSDESCLGETFLKFTPYLKMYTQYVSNHEAAINFDKVLSQQQRFLRVQPQIFGQPRMVGSPNLAFFLIMPIQRIPRYSLLLSELIKTTPESHNDYPHLKKALEQVNEVAMKVNSEIAAQQNRQLVYEKTQMLGLDEARFVQPSRHFVKQGPMTKVCRSKDTCYEFFLFNDVLIYASRITGLGKFKVHQEIPIDSSFGIQDSRDDEKRANQFKIINSIKSFAVYADSPQIKAEWMKILTELIHQAKSKIQKDEDAGHIVPVWIPDDQANKCLCCSSEFTFFNRKHHCRFCGGVVCGGCSKRKAFLGQGKKEERICDQCVDLRTKFSQMQLSDGTDAPPASPGPTTATAPAAAAATPDPVVVVAPPAAVVAAPPVSNQPKPTFKSNPETYKPTPIRFHAIASNPAADVGDLEFELGETILVYYRAPDGWWTGTNSTGDKHGIFQSTLVTATESNTPEPINQPLNASLIIAEQPETNPPGAPEYVISYQSGQIVIVMHQLNDWSLVYNLSSGSMGWLPSTAIVMLNTSDDEPNTPVPPTPTAATSVPPTAPTMTTPPIPTMPEPKLPSIPLPDSPPTMPTPASPRALPPPSSPPPNSPRALPPPSSPPPGPSIPPPAMPAAATPAPPVPTPVAVPPVPTPVAVPPVPTPAAAPAIPAAAPAVPPPAAAPVNKLGPPPARGPPPAASQGAAGPTPQGGCNTCKCDTFRCTPIKKTTCVDCGHAATDHRMAK